MKAVASKLSRLLLIFSLAVVVVGALLMNPMIFGVGGVMALCARFLIAPDIGLQSPEAQYWSRSLVFSGFAIFTVGVGLGLGLHLTGFSRVLSEPGAYLFDASLLGLIALLKVQTLPSLLESSWKIHLKEQSRETETVMESPEDAPLDLHWSRFIVRASATGFFVSAVLVGLAAFT